MISNLYPPVAFFPATAAPSTLKFSYSQALSEKFTTVSYKIGVLERFTYPRKTRVMANMGQYQRPLRSYDNSLSLYPLDDLISVCFLPRPPACLPIRVNACGQHGYWFSPATTYPENFEFELVVEGKANEVSSRPF